MPQEATAELEQVLRIDTAGREGSEVQVGEVARIVAVESGPRQDILETDEQRGHVVVEKEGAHLDRFGGVSFVVKEDVDAAKRSGNSGLL